MKDIMQGELCPRFLDDNPCSEESAFPIHDAISGAIAYEVRCDSRSDNIALIGSWGSGKSTIVEMVEAKLDNYFLFFKFDAWAHSGDSLRRTFLSSLLDAVCMKMKEGTSTRSPKEIAKIQNEIDDSIYGRTAISRISEDVSFQPIVSAFFVAFVFYSLIQWVTNSCSLIDPSIGHPFFIVEWLGEHGFLIAHFGALLVFIGVLIYLHLQGRKNGKKTSVS